MIIRKVLKKKCWVAIGGESDYEITEKRERDEKGN